MPVRLGGRDFSFSGRARAGRCLASFFAVQFGCCLFLARRFVALAAATGQAHTLAREAAARAHSAEAVGHQLHHVGQPLHTGAYQQVDQGVLEA